MSNEIISISASNGDNSTIVEVLPALPVKAEPSELCAPSAVINHIMTLTPSCIVSQAALSSRQSTALIE
jgi:hypothetical protein